MRRSEIAEQNRFMLLRQREFRIAEKSYGADHLDLVVTSGYLGKLIGNARVVRYLAQHYREILTEFQKLAGMDAAAA